MKLKRLLSVLDVCECTADPELDIRDISFDSRTTQPGDLFAAVCGYESDGHRFIGAAAERGAAVVLCQRKPEVEIPYILVADSRLALSRICCEFFDNPSRELTMIGVTGTNGKTTVTTLIKHMLEQCLHTKVGLIGTNANVIGDEVLHTEHTTPDAYELQKLLRRMVDARGHGGVVALARAAPCGGHPLPGGHLHEPVAGPSGLSQDHGGVCRGQGAAVCAE